ncbi:MAG: hypothetical protein AABY88_11030 [Pseudomonadota bacterium]
MRLIFSLYGRHYCYRIGRIDRRPRHANNLDVTLDPITIAPRIMVGF